MSQLTVNAIVTSPHGVPLESPHRVKVGNGQRESISVRGPLLTDIPANIDPYPSGAPNTTYYDWVYWDWYAAHGLDNSSPFGTSGVETFYDNAVTYLGALNFTEDWTEPYQDRTINLSVDPTTDVTANSTANWAQFDGTIPAPWLHVPSYVEATAMSGWRSDYHSLLLIRGQARYVGPKLWIPYWQGRVRITGGAAAYASMIRIDSTGGGWMPVSGGQLVVTTNYTDGTPFPPEQVEQPLESGFYQWQPVQLDANFTILGVDGSTLKQQWGIDFGVWF